MRGYFIDIDGRYYEGDRIDPSHQSIPRRPDSNHEFINGVWAYVAPPSPPVVSIRQARLALLNAGLLPTVNTAIAAMTGTPGDAARIEWEFSPTLKRNHPLVASLSTSLGLSSAQLDDLFTQAAAL